MQINTGNLPIYDCWYNTTSTPSDGIRYFVPRFANSAVNARGMDYPNSVYCFNLVLQVSPDEDYDTEKTYKLGFQETGIAPFIDFELNITDVKGSPLKSGAWTANQSILLGVYSVQSADRTEPLNATLIGGASSGGTVTQNFAGSGAGTAASINADTLGGQLPTYFRSDTFSVTIPASKWTASGTRWVASISVPGVTQDTIIQTIYSSQTDSPNAEAISENMSYINAINTTTNNMTFQCFYTKPTIDLPIECVWVK